jgi:hypothetical protein
MFPIIYHSYDLKLNNIVLWYFLKAGGESQSSPTAKNYTTDSRHLVLLKGYQLTGDVLLPYK